MRSETAQRLITLGYIMALAMPPLGFALGIGVAARLPAPRSKHGLWIILVSLVAAVAWFFIIKTGALNTTNSNY